MKTHLRSLATAALVTTVVVFAAPRSKAQIEPYNFKFNSGQTIQPIFEGWSRNPDGTIDMHFGYLNRNYVEELHVPIGPENSIEPGGPDRGQPTFFYTRTNRNAFTVTVPKDWGKRELTWTLTVRGKTEKAIGWLQAEWEASAASPSGGGRTGPDSLKNQPPTLAVDPVQPVGVGGSLKLTAHVTDDGLPKPSSGRGKPAVGQETPPTLQGSPEAPVNVPQVATPARGRGRGARPQGPTVTWIVWRGPAGVAFDSNPTPVKDGQAITTATFSVAGAYVLQARASDGMLSTMKEVKVTVNPSPSQKPVR